MKRKLLILTALLVGCALHEDRSASAIVTCGFSTCSNPATECYCAANTPAAGMLTECRYWRADCYWM